MDFNLTNCLNNWPLWFKVITFFIFLWIIFLRKFPTLRCKSYGLILWTRKFLIRSNLMLFLSLWQPWQTSNPSRHDRNARCNLNDFKPHKFCGMECFIRGDNKYNNPNKRWQIKIELRVQLWWYYKTIDSNLVCRAYES